MQGALSSGMYALGEMTLRLKEEGGGGIHLSYRGAGHLRLIRPANLQGLLSISPADRDKFNSQTHHQCHTAKRRMKLYMRSPLFVTLKCFTERDEILVDSGEKTARAQYPAPLRTGGT